MYNQQLTKIVKSDHADLQRRRFGDKNLLDDLLKQWPGIWLPTDTGLKLGPIL